MAIDLESYASEKDAVGVIEGMLQLGDNYFESSYTRCAIQDGRIEPRSIRNRARTSHGQDDARG